MERKPWVHERMNESDARAGPITLSSSSDIAGVAQALVLSGASRAVHHPDTMETRERLMRVLDRLVDRATMVKRDSPTHQERQTSASSQNATS